MWLFGPRGRASVNGLGRRKVTTKAGISELNSQAGEPSRNTVLRDKTQAPSDLQVPIPDKWEVEARKKWRKFCKK